MKLNIANKLTLARIVLVPFFAFFIIYPVFTYEHTTWSRIIAAAIFILAAITDFLDGKIARKKQIITHFGKFMDPLANMLGKIKTVSQFVCIIVVLLEPIVFPTGGFLSLFSMVIMVVFTIWSGVHYIRQYWNFLDPSV